MYITSSCAGRARFMHPTCIIIDYITRTRTNYMIEKYLSNFSRDVVNVLLVRGLQSRPRKRGTHSITVWTPYCTQQASQSACAAVGMYIAMYIAS